MHSFNRIEEVTGARSYFSEIIGINLEYALEAYDWEGWNPMTNDGVTVAGFWDKSKGIPDTEYYELDERGVYLKKGAPQRNSPDQMKIPQSKARGREVRR